jgi:Ser/Thr protein kinase RdoA (MazF antagonist)
LEKREFAWALNNCVHVRKHLNLVDSDCHESINLVLDNFQHFVLDQTNQLSMSIIHGDINEQNLIVQQELSAGDRKKPDQVQFALIDFGDVHYAPTVFDVAIFMTYVLIVCTEVGGLEIGKYVLDGVKSVANLTDYETKVLPVILIQFHRFNFVCF